MIKWEHSVKDLPVAFQHKLKEILLLFHSSCPLLLLYKEIVTECDINDKALYWVALLISL